MRPVWTGQLCSHTFLPLFTHARRSVKSNTKEPLFVLPTMVTRIFSRLQYSLEGHQFAVFDFQVTSDYRYIVSISNRFITWDLSTSDMTRNVNPGLEGIMQALCLSPDNRYAAAYTNNNQVKYLIKSGGIASKKTIQKGKRLITSGYPFPYDEILSTPPCIGDIPEVINHSNHRNQVVLNHP